MTIRCLLLEDSPADAELILRQLRKTVDDLDVRHVTRREDFERELTAYGPDIVLSDHTIPHYGGRQALTYTRQVAPDTPFILITGSLDEETAVEYMKAGADDYLLKDRVARLGNAVVACLESRNAKREQQRLQAAAEESLRAQREFLRAVIDLTPSFVFVKDSKGRFVLANPPLASHYDTTVEDLLGKTDADFNAHPEEVEQIQRSDTAVIEQQQVRLIQEERMTNARTGKPHWFQTVKIPARLPGHSGPLVLGVSTDLTERRNLEQQLRLAQKMEAIATLAGGIAHDFNNILSAMKATADLLLMELPTDAAARPDLVAVSSLVDRASALTRKLLAFSRKQTLDPRAVDVKEVAEGVVRMIERIIGADVQLHVEYAEDPAIVWTEPGQVEQVLMNLIVNARDAMPQGGELTVRIGRTVFDEAFSRANAWARPGDYVQICVQDTGDGMDEETIARIFEPFFTTKEPGRGTGLGLAVVYGIVQQHSGLIHVTSNRRKGTTFNLYFPFHDAPPHTITRHFDAIPVGGTERILVVEDDETVRNVGVRLLRHLGYDVTVAADGQEADSILEQERGRFDLVVLDMVMPGMSGLTLFEQSRVRYPRVRFLFTTGYSRGTAHTAPFQKLPAPLLSKPYGVLDLAAAVRSALDNARA